MFLGSHTPHHFHSNFTQKRHIIVYSNRKKQSRFHCTTPALTRSRFQNIFIIQSCRELQHKAPDSLVSLWRSTHDVFRAHAKFPMRPMLRPETRTFVYVSLSRTPRVCDTNLCFRTWFTEGRLCAKFERNRCDKYALVPLFNRFVCFFLAKFGQSSYSSYTLRRGDGTKIRSPSKSHHNCVA